MAINGVLPETDRLPSFTPTRKFGAQWKIDRFDARAWRANDLWHFALSDRGVSITRSGRTMREAVSSVLASMRSKLEAAELEVSVARDAISQIEAASNSVP